MLSPKNNVLVVEDHPFIRHAALDFLRAAGFEVVEAGDADEAIRVLEARPDIHLVFTDVKMPGSIDGMKLAHYIRDRWPPVKLIVVSGRTNIEQSHLPPGARFFSKPYDENSIVDAMRGMLVEATT